MDTFEQFRGELSDALTHLYDPDHQFSHSLFAATEADPRDGAAPVQSVLLGVIEGLRPREDIPRSAHTSLIYHTLYNRFVLKLSQEETSERMSVSVRQLRRLQRQASHLLARLLWERIVARKASEEGLASVGEAQPPSEQTAPGDRWRDQVQQELASLQMSDPGAVANVGETVRAAVGLERVVAKRQGVGLVAAATEPHLFVALHPSALRQVLISAIGNMVRIALEGPVLIAVEQAAGHVEITLTCPASMDAKLPNGEFIKEIIQPVGGSLDIGQERGSVRLAVRLPSAGQVTVLVVDDNAEVVHFYRRSLAGTRYRVVHIAEGTRVFEVADAILPEVIVLDIMLPDVDGWELLAQLHEHPATRSIPVVVCSVVREAELALALGATIHLPKPVQPRQFIQALDQALAQRSSEASGFRGSTRQVG